MSIDNHKLEDDVRTNGEIISDIRSLLTEIDTRLFVINTELDILRSRYNGGV